MNRTAASLAAALSAIGLAACGGGGAEPDAPTAGAAAPAVPLELVLDFQPNAVHSGIYLAEARDEFAQRGLDPTIRAPGASSDAPKLLRTGRADLAILDIHDLAIARERGADLVGVAAVAQRPLAAVIAADREAVRRPADLEGSRVGVTGLPSDDAVLESVLESDGLALDDVDTVTIGFESVPNLASGELAAATAFWNAEGVALAELDVPTREFRVADFGAPPYPELVLVADAERLERDREPIAAAVAAIAAGHEELTTDPEAGLEALLEAASGLERGSQRRQLEALLDAGALDGSVALDREVLEDWADWDVERGVVERRPDLDAAFNLELGGR